MTEENRSVLAFNLSFMFEKKTFLTGMFRQLLSWLQEGRLVVPPTTLFPMEQIVDAHKLIESGTSTGILFTKCAHTRTHLQLRSGKIVVTTQFFRERADRWFEKEEPQTQQKPCP